jgi:multidrug resistance efflux pump
MASNYDATDFVDGDFERSKAGAVSSTPAGRAPSREEVDSKVAEAQLRLAELKRAQEELERERAALEETRRRQLEFHNGREEMIQSLTRGVGLLEEAEFSARRDAEQMAKAVAGLREALEKIQAIHEDTWTKDNFAVELTRALTALENARMEWNTARLKFSLLSGQVEEPNATPAAPAAPTSPLMAAQTFGDLCRIGFALTWPLAAVGLITLGVLVAFLLRG